MAVEEQINKEPQNVPMSVNAQREMGPQNAPVSVEIKRKMEPQNAVASQLGAFETKGVHTPDSAEPAPAHKEQRHVSDYKKKKEKRKKKRLEKAAEELRLKVSEELRLKAAKNQEKIQAMDKVFPMQGKTKEIESRGREDIDIQNDEVFDKLTEQRGTLLLQGKDEYLKSEFRKGLDKHYNEAFDKLTKQQQNAIIAYTEEYNEETPNPGEPYYRTMNSILRKGVYKEGKGENIVFEEGVIYEDDVVEKSKKNYEAVTDCINALKESKLPTDMVFRRGTNLQTLLRMLRLNSSNDEAAIMENIDKYNKGNEIISDRGFLSTASFSDAGFEGKVEWIIQGHAGDEAFFIANHSEFPDEGEMLFQAGTRFRLLRICPPGTGGVIYKCKEGQQEKTWKVYMETVPELKPLRGKDK